MTRTALFVLALGACTSPRTEVIIVTDTDLPVPSEVDEMRIDVTGPGGEVQSAAARFEEGDPLPPRSLGLVHDNGRLGPYRVHARAMNGGGIVVERVAEFDFQPGRTLVLRLDLLRSCITTECGVDETCAEGGCRSIVIEPDELEEWNGQLPMRDGAIETPDAGPFDAGDCVPMSEVCDGEDNDCDRMVDELFDLTSDPMNCGSCGRACTFTNATGSCTDSDCVIDTCDEGFDDCDADATNGCEADLTAPTSCGDCATECRPPMRDCCDGACGSC